MESPATSQGYELPQSTPRMHEETVFFHKLFVAFLCMYGSAFTAARLWVQSDWISFLPGMATICIVALHGATLAASSTWGGGVYLRLLSAQVVFAATLWTLSHAKAQNHLRDLLGNCSSTDCASVEEGWRIDGRLPLEWALCYQILFLLPFRHAVCASAFSVAVYDGILLALGEDFDAMSIAALIVPVCICICGKRVSERKDLQRGLREGQLVSQLTRHLPQLERVQEAAPDIQVTDAEPSQSRPWPNPGDVFLEQRPRNLADVPSEPRCSPPSSFSLTLSSSQHEGALQMARVADFQPAVEVQKQPSGQSSSLSFTLSSTPMQDASNGAASPSSPPLPQRASSLCSGAFRVFGSRAHSTQAVPDGQPSSMSMTVSSTEADHVLEGAMTMLRATRASLSPQPSSMSMTLSSVQTRAARGLFHEVGVQVGRGLAEAEPLPLDAASQTEIVERCTHCSKPPPLPRHGRRVMPQELPQGSKPTATAIMVSAISRPKRWKPSGPLRYGHLRETPTHVMMQMLVHTFMSWNVKIPSERCCELHALAAEAAYVLSRNARKLSCLQKAHTRVRQCPTCFAVRDTAEEECEWCDGNLEDFDELIESSGSDLQLSL